MNTPLDSLRIKIALDTQILAYLVDNTYPNITAFIKILSENKFVDIICSRFAIYEFIGIRKLEHYLRALIKQSEVLGGQVNFSSALKYKRDFDAPELKYIDIYEEIKQKVEEDLKKIFSDLYIDYDNSVLHRGLWIPHQDLVLSTRISKEDSLLLISSVFPEPFRKEPYLIFLSNDNQFIKALNKNGEKEISDKIFKKNDLSKPVSYNIRNVTLEDKTAINLLDSSDRLSVKKLNAFTSKFLKEHLRRKNHDFLIGETITCACNQKLKNELLCFKLENKKELRENMYLYILYQDENNEYQSYIHPVPLSDFQNRSKKVSLPYEASETDEKSNEIAIRLVDRNGELLDENLMKKISSKGNLVFIHPDS